MAASLIAVYAGHVCHVKESNVANVMCKQLETMADEANGGDDR